MASSLLFLIDDIASILDDVSVMTKVAAKKTVGVLGDDLALNAQQVAGVKADRELPVVWAVAKGSAINKAILVPAALAISVFLPAWVTTALLMIGGAFLCFEGFEKIAHRYMHSAPDLEDKQKALATAVANPDVNLVQLEKDKIKGAIRTDFILSAEIIVISLGTLGAATLQQKVGVLIAVSILMTIGVYGLVAGIVKLDDLGLWLSKKASNVAQNIGLGILWFAPWLMKSLSVIGTLAMFLVGGSIISHGVPALHILLESLVVGMGTIGKAVLPVVADGLIGLIVGAVIVAVVLLFKKLNPSS